MHHVTQFLLWAFVPKVRDSHTRAGQASLKKSLAGEDHAAVRVAFICVTKRFSNHLANHSSSPASAGKPDLVVGVITVGAEVSREERYAAPSLCVHLIELKAGAHG